MSERPVDALFLEVQEALAGEYSLDRELGRGGMGVVYLAREVRLAREVALKVLPPELASSTELREQFLREAQMAARLSHPNIVPIHRVGEAGAFVFFAMVYVPGITLGEHVRTRGPLVPDHAIRVLREVAWALTYAHTSGLVHRDVKPDNIMLEAGTGRTLVTDFGIAHTSHTVDALSSDGRVVGTAHYMSPEQAMGEPVDARSDIYSLGVAAYYALTTRHPFEGASPQAILAKHLNETAVPIRTISPVVPQRLAHAVERCLAKDPAQRFQRASEFADAIEQSIEPVREIPPAIRVWLAREDKTRVPRFFAGVYGGGGALAAIGGAGAPVLGVVAGAVILTGAIAVPTVINTRKVLRAGYSLSDLRESQLRHWSRRREELAIELGETRPVSIVAATKWVAGSVGLGMLAAFMARGPSADEVGTTVAVVALVAGAAMGIVRKIRHTRAQLRIPPVVRLWSGKWGERIVKVASIRLRPVAQQALGGQATEVALGRATDALFTALPAGVRKQLDHVPGTVRRLEKEATVLRGLIRDLEMSLASVDSNARQNTASAETAALRADLQRAREDLNQRLANTVAALETIRLGLIRLQLGTGQVEMVTATLDAAKAVADDIERAADAQKEVERLLRATQSHAKLEA